MDSNEIPEWVQSAIEHITSGIEFKGPADIQWRYSEPEGTSWGIDLIEIAPALMDLSEFGEESGEQGYGIIHSFDLIEAQKALDQVDALSFGIENDGNSCIIMEGKIGEINVVVLIYTEPFTESSDN